MKRIINIFLHKHLIFLILFILFSYSYGLFEVMNSGPISLHQWRQADCLSITQNYGQDNLPFLEPQIHWQGETNNGKTISEFPIFYYSIGKLWNFTGRQYWIYRLLNLTILFIGLFYLKKTTQLLLKNHFWSHFIPLLLFTSPILVYYSNNFLMNSTSFSIALIAGYHIARYCLERQYVNVIYACLLFALAGLLKITALILFFGVAGILVYDILRYKSFQKRGRELLPFVVTLGINAAWYSYSSWYNDQNLKHIFLQGILPVWEMNSDQANNNLDTLINTLSPEFLNPGLLIFLFLGLLVMLIFRRAANKYFLALSCLLIFGSAIYIILFFQVFDVHDYYLTNLLIIVPSICMLLLLSLKQFNNKIISSLTIKVTAVLILLISASMTTVRNRVKYTSQNEIITNSPLLDISRKNYWNWYHWNYAKTFRGLETIENYLNNIGVTKDKKVISVPDETINVSLFLMNRKGFNDFGYPHLQKDERIEWAKQKGAEYLIVNDTSILGSDYLQPYIKRQIGKHKNVLVFEL